MNKEQKKMNNKGFSLVELIIVIAIMAILVGALAPQFIKYVERSRKSTDCQNVATIITALQVYYADPMVASADQLSSGATVVLNTSGEATTTGNADKAMEAAGLTLADMQLKGSWPASSGNISSYTITATITNGALSFSGTTLATDYDIIKGKYK